MEENLLNGSRYIYYMVDKVDPLINAVSFPGYSSVRPCLVYTNNSRSFGWKTHLVGLYGTVALTMLHKVFSERLKWLFDDLGISNDQVTLHFYQVTLFSFFFLAKRFHWKKKGNKAYKAMWTCY